MCIDRQRPINGEGLLLHTIEREEIVGVVANIERSDRLLQTITRVLSPFRDICHITLESA